ncbi:hypothetical protein Rxyl_2508 [Rubrobacter xylanophilus DSM 9941]|uniref:Uncharacterized protein n=1 Tax=Rubrobacter xylanophilus (strain DSM 9941 / JCM 11954 / NBRC 16129 / PRD-1) TaxID=266117 RepID=Q1AT49_RUBXD|nr:hypothetical protein [Rubrobacter xylanophilus]ABG05429.1 hypothetical protein Rxyl_2508 [Rubrobacter xylanophilus DSM 9941]
MIDHSRQLRVLTAAMAGVALAVAAILLAVQPWAWAAAASVKVVGSVTTVRPNQTTPDDWSTQADLKAAKNEFESFQVVVEAAGDQPITGLQIQKDAAGDPDVNLTQVDANGTPIPGGATIANSNITV